MIGGPADGRASAGRVQTGVPHLDDILGGGFPRNSINIIMGHPGTGKTILAEQMVFHNADSERPILYLTTLSEPLDKVLAYLQEFSFYDEARMIDRVVYEDIGAALLADGPGVLVDRVRDAIHERGPQIIVVDSFKAIHDLTPEGADMRRLVAELAGVLTAYQTTAFLVGEYSEDQIPRFSEFAVADGIIEFARRSTAKRDDRFLRVLKLRGSRYAEGFHAFTITSDGLEVYPRLITPNIPPDHRIGRDRVATGIERLDVLLDGGLWRGSSTLLKGQAGSGKTTIALQFALQGVLEGESALYVNFQENPAQLARSVAALGADLDDLRARGLILNYASPVELTIDRVVVDIFELMREHDVKRVVIDALGDIMLAADDLQRFHDYLYALCQHFIVHGVTTLLTLEAQPYQFAGFMLEEARFSSMVDCLIEIGIEMRGTPRRILRVVKARGIAHDMRVHEMVIEPGGVSLGDPLVQP